MMQRIHLISGPRNISTAMMYSFAQRPNCLVVDEPFYAAYLAETGILHPGREEVLQTQNNEREGVLKSVFLENGTTEELFIKNMAHHILPTDWQHFSHLKNFFLIRDPKRIIASYAKVIGDFGLDDLGLKQQFEIAEFLQKNGQKVIVADTGELIKNPATYIASLCEALEIEFYPFMLEWQAGPRPEDGIWAKHWYANVHKSTGLKPKLEKAIELDSKYTELLEEAQEYYLKLKAFEIKH